jgi:hypothetical protein
VNKAELKAREAAMHLRDADGKPTKATQPDYSAHKDTLKADGTPLHHHPQRAGVFERDKSGKLVAEITPDGKRVPVDEYGNLPKPAVDLDDANAKPKPAPNVAAAANPTPPQPAAAPALPGAQS